MSFKASSDEVLMIRTIIKLQVERRRYVLIFLEPRYDIK